MNRRKQRRVQTRRTPTTPSTASADDAREATDTASSSEKLIEADISANGETAKNRRRARVYLIAAAQAVLVIPLLYYLHFEEINAYALSLTVFVVVLCLLVALGYSVPDRPDSQTRAALRGGPFDYVGAFWLAACAFGPFFGWLVTAAYTLTEENWRWRYVVRLALCMALPALTALPLFVYVRGRHWHVALLLLFGVTALPVWSGVNTLRDLREGPSVRRTTGLYDAPHNSFYPVADGRPFVLTQLPHTQRTIKIEPAPTGER